MVRFQVRWPPRLLTGRGRGAASDDPLDETAADRAARAAATAGAYPATISDTPNPTSTDQRNAQTPEHGE
jgi:hypothetical protein